MPCHLRPRRLLPLLLIACACAAPACSSDPAPPDLRERLERDTATPWGVDVDARSHAVRFLTPATPVKIGEGSPESVARAFFARYAGDLGFTRSPDELRLAVFEGENGGGTYLRFAHYLPGTELPVFDVSTIAHFRADGAVWSIEPGFRKELADVPRAAAVSAEAAHASAEAFIAASCGIEQGSPLASPTTLGVAADEGTPLALAYRVAFEGVTARCLAPVVDVDASTGAVLRMHAGAAAATDTAPGARYYMLGDQSAKRTFEVTRHWHPFSKDTYTLESSSPHVTTQYFVEERNKVPLGRTYESTTLGAWDATDPTGPGSAVDAHANAAEALRYFREVHGRNSIDGKGGDVDVIVHDNTVNAGGKNAHYYAYPHTTLFFFHSQRDTISFGDGDIEEPLATRNRLPFAMAFDITAHEIAHGVTAHTSALKYERESGALNESFSDVMGASAQNRLEPYARGAAIVLGGSHKRDGKGRNMSDPVDPTTNDYVSERHYSTLRRCAEGETPEFKPNDFCGVHYNSGIPNLAWSLMTLGGTHPTTRVTVSTPIGWENAQTLWYETLTKLPQQATFRDAAQQQINWTATHRPQLLIPVACAWFAVGVALDASVSPIAAAIVCPTSPLPAPPSPPAPPAPPSPPSGACAGHADGWACSPVEPSSAYRCNSGASAGTAVCADSAQRCRRASPTDPTATIDPDGALVCE